MKRAPAERYDTSIKAAYRETLWALMMSGKKPGPAMILTGPDGHEIPVLRMYGFEDSMFHLVDRNPKFILSATKKQEVQPTAKAYMGEVSDAIAHMEKNGERMSFVNLDFEGTVAGSVLPALRYVVTTPSVFKGARVALCWQRARDSKVTDYLMKESGAINRLQLVERLIEKYWPDFCFCGEGEYDNGANGKTMPMQWAVFDLK